MSRIYTFGKSKKHRIKSFLDVLKRDKIAGTNYLIKDLLTTNWKAGALPD